MTGPREDITVATHDDCDAAAAILGSGFSDDPVMSWVFEDRERAHRLGQVFAFVLREFLIDFGATYLTDDAAACWTPPEPPPWPEERGARFLGMLAGIASPEEIGRFGVMNAAMEAAHPAQPHWYLGMIATRRGERSRGHGTGLMVAALERVDESGLPAYLESSNPRNVSLYLRHGFEVSGTIPIEGGPAMTAMWREPLGGRRGTAAPR